MKHVLLLMTICLFAFSGCKKNEEKEISLLVGTWADNGETERLFTKFNEDGTGREWILYNGKEESVDNFRYFHDVSKNSLEFHYDNRKIVLKVVELSKTKLSTQYLDAETLTQYRQ